LDEPQPGSVQTAVPDRVDAPVPALVDGQKLRRRYTVTVEEGIEYVDDIEEWSE
jgi:hypothetical protein